jgi:hypothetical protein
MSITHPLALVESGQRLTHQPRLVDESTPTRRAHISDHDDRAEFKAGEGGPNFWCAGGPGGGGWGAAANIGRCVNTLGTRRKAAVVGDHDGSGRCVSHFGMISPDGQDEPHLSFV